MCLILDANIVHHVFPLPSPDFRPINRALLMKRARLAYGGRLTLEYNRIDWFRRLLVQLDRSGVAFQCDSGLVNAETARLERSGLCVSDDPHIIALAAVSRIRLLCSNDHDLHADFKNRALLNPPGSVYQNSTHKHLLLEHCGGVEGTE